MPDNTETLENVKLLFRNFAGKAKPFNDAGNRNFSVLLTPELADELSAKGWNVTTTKERAGDDEEILGGDPILKVKVNYSGRPPTVVLITSRGRNNLDEDEIKMLDYAEITNVDLMINPYDWTVNGKTGRKAYLRSIYVTIHEDYLEQKYGDMPSSSTPARHDGDDI